MEAGISSSGGVGQYSGTNKYRHKDAFYFLPSRDEWYKGAYGDPAGAWYDYPTGSNSPPTAVTEGVDTGTAVFGQPNYPGSPADIYNAGSFSNFGTMAQGGNAWEWTEGAYDGTNDTVSEYLILNGGYWGNSEGALSSSWRAAIDPTFENLDYGIGFRIASVPEPSTGWMMVLGIGTLLCLRAKRSLLQE